MKINCKPGDLAIVIRTENNAQSGVIGKVVDGAGQGPWGFDWLVEFDHDVRYSRGGFGKTAYVPDAWLRPIRPGEEDESIVRDLFQPTEEGVTA